MDRGAMRRDWMRRSRRGLLVGDSPGSGVSGGQKRNIAVRADAANSSLPCGSWIRGCASEGCLEFGGRIMLRSTNMDPWLAWSGGPAELLSC